MKKRKNYYSIDEHLKFMYLIHDAEKEIKMYNLTDPVNEMINQYRDNDCFENKLLNMINLI